MMVTVSATRLPSPTAASPRESKSSVELALRVPATRYGVQLLVVVHNDQVLRPPSSLAPGDSIGGPSSLLVPRRAPPNVVREEEGEEVEGEEHERGNSRRDPRSD